MTPAARVQTAIELLDQILAGDPAERVLTGWARRSRFAGSKDRAAIRDHVFDVLRRRNSCAARGAGRTDGRGLMTGLLWQDGVDPRTLFTGGPYGPEPLTGAEQTEGPDDGVLDLPEWLIPQMQASLGDEFAETERALRQRAPVMLRMNTRKSDMAQAIRVLAADGIVAETHPIADTALKVTTGMRRVANGEAYKSGLVELQDGSSQAAAAAISLTTGARVLDYCAGGGGKSLALAARVTGQFWAHDSEPARMGDLPARAARAGVEVTPVTSEEINEKDTFDAVICDVPCSGSGAWRRSPDAKWRFTADRLAALNEVQSEILHAAAPRVAPGGRLIYMTCSVLDAENRVIPDRFLAQNAGWRVTQVRHWPVSDGGDGFFMAQLDRE